MSQEIGHSAEVQFYIVFQIYSTVSSLWNDYCSIVSYFDVSFGLVSSKLLSKTTALREIIVLDLYAFTSVVAKQPITIYQSIAASFYKIAYLKHNWRCKLGMHELSSAERNARYRRFFELLNNPPGLYQIILNLLSVSYRNVYSVMRHLHNRKVSEKRLLIMVNCFSLKKSIFNKRNNFTFICLMLLCYFTFNCLVDIILNYELW
jgi:hypothetical protein